MATAQEIQAWFAANPNVPAEEVAMLMQQNGVSPAEVAGALGRDVGEVTGIYNQALGIQPQIQTGLIGREQALQGGYQSALAALMQGANTGRADLMAARDLATKQAETNFNRGEAYFQPYMQAGQQALGLQGALSGAQGQAAFDAAYTDSPYMRFLQEQGDRTVTRNSAAIGGLGGGNVQKELVRYGQGLAGQGLQQQIQNLSGLSGIGLNAAQGGAQMAGNQGTALAGITQRAGEGMSNLAMQAGGQIGNYAFNTGQMAAQGRTDYGNLLAGQINNTANNMANLSMNQGGQYSNIIGQGAGNLATILQNAGVSQADALRIMATAQAQTASNAGANMAGVQGTPGMPSNNLQQFGQLAGGLGSMISAFG